MTDLGTIVFKHWIHLNLNFAFMVLIGALILGRGRGFRTSLLVWSAVLLRFLCQPWLCPEGPRVPEVNFAGAGSLSLSFGSPNSARTFFMDISLDGKRLSAGDLGALALGENLASVLGLLGLFVVTISVLCRLRILWRHRGDKTGVFWCPDSDTAYVSGWWKPSIVMPQKARQLLREEELLAVQAHEEAHLANHDHWFFAVIYLLRSFSMIIPPLAIALNNLELALEKRCDQSAAERYGSKTVARALVALSSHNPSTLPCPGFSHRCVKLRVRALRQGYSKDSRLSYVWFLYLRGFVLL